MDMLPNKQLCCEKGSIFFQYIGRYRENFGCLAFNIVQVDLTVDGAA